MSGKGCQLMVSPCTVSPSLRKIRRHGSQSIKAPVASPHWGGPPFPCVDKSTTEKQSGSHIALPSLSLRRKVLTNGKHGAKLSSLHQKEPPDTTMQRGNWSCAVSRPVIEVLGHPASSNLTVTSIPMSIHPYDVTSRAAHHPPLDARSLLSRESLASTTLSLFETQSVFSSRHDWPFGYRVLPPLGQAPCSIQASEGGEQLSLPPGTAMSGTTASSASASLPSYLFTGDSGSPRQPKKRALSMSPLSDVMGIDFNSIIRTSPTSLVAYINGSRSSPASHSTLSPVQSEGYGHYLGGKGSWIPQLHSHFVPNSSNTLAPLDECTRMKVLEEGGVLENQANMVVAQQCLSDPQEVHRTSETSRQETSNILPPLQLQPAQLTAQEVTIPQGPPPPYHSHQHIHHLPRSYHKKTQDLHSQGPPRHGLGFLPQVPMLEEEEGELEDYGTHCCMWMDCNAVYDQKDELVRHIEKIHVDQRKAEDFTCYWVGCPRDLKPFNARYKLLIHMRVHSGEKPNKCKFKGCKKAFSRLENLKIHLRSHTGEKPYLCQHPGCFKAFSNSSDRAKHQRTHLDTKPYACQVAGCAKRYTDPSSLRKHIKSHSNAERQLRKKMKSTVDVTEDPLADCLTIHHLHPSLSPPDNLTASSRAPCEPCSSAKQRQDSSHNPSLNLTHTLQDNHRFGDHRLFCGDPYPPPSCLPHPPDGTSQDMKQPGRAPDPAADYSPELSGPMEALYCYDGMDASSHLMRVGDYSGRGNPNGQTALSYNTGFDV
ncbi:zinc finger protein GLIS3 [Dunckerocampus dactyliophorus]|uniref:zinc finger protein GLIS3 n=1 Tax=Dunckerocampus dactyliophorus TaxID=161453 RepID=UPI002405B10A|nr:zinc finger protein GLIS3 [Dunckerocampus dactyliophorus]